MKNGQIFQTFVPEPVKFFYALKIVKGRLGEASKEKKNHTKTISCFSNEM